MINWPEATDNLRVCARPGRHEYNCGRCEKCLRTRLELLVSGCESSAAFGETRFDPDFLEGIEIGNDYQAACYADILDALDKSAHRSLGERIAAMLSAYLELAAQENRRRKGLGANFA